MNLITRPHRRDMTLPMVRQSHVDGAKKLAVFLLRLEGFGKFTPSLIKRRDGFFKSLGLF